jgi:hypothetical protein
MDHIVELSDRAFLSLDFMLGSIKSRLPINLCLESLGLVPK